MVRGWGEGDESLSGDLAESVHDCNRTCRADVFEDADCRDERFLFLHLKCRLERLDSSSEQ